MSIRALILALVALQLSLQPLTALAHPGPASFGSEPCCCERAPVLETRTDGCCREEPVDDAPVDEDEDCGCRVAPEPAPLAPVEPARSVEAPRVLSNPAALVARAVVDAPSGAWRGRVSGPPGPAGPRGGAPLTVLNQVFRL